MCQCQSPRHRNPAGLLRPGRLQPRRDLPRPRQGQPLGLTLLPLRRRDLLLLQVLRGRAQQPRRVQNLPLPSPRPLPSRPPLAAPALSPPHRFRLIPRPKRFAPMLRPLIFRPRMRLPRVLRLPVLLPPRCPMPRLPKREARASLLQLPAPHLQFPAPHLQFPARLERLQVRLQLSPVRPWTSPRLIWMRPMLLRATPWLALLALLEPREAHPVRARLQAPGQCRAA